MSKRQNQAEIFPKSPSNTPPDLYTLSVGEVVIDAFEAVSSAVMGGVIGKPILVIHPLLPDQVEGCEGQCHRRPQRRQDHSRRRKPTLAVATTHSDA